MDGRLPFLFLQIVRRLVQHVSILDAPDSFLLIERIRNACSSSRTILPGSMFADTRELLILATDHRFQSCRGMNARILKELIDIRRCHGFSIQRSLLAILIRC